MTSDDEFRAATDSVSNALRGAMNIRAGEDNNFEKTKSLVDFPIRPLVNMVDLPGLPSVLINLRHRGPEGRAAWKALKRHGLAPYTSLLGKAGPLPFAPDGWGYAVWPSQVLVLASAPDKSPRKVVFEQFQGDLDWYRSISESSGGLLGMFVINETPTEFTADHLESLANQGRVLGGALAGMLMNEV